MAIKTVLDEADLSRVTEAWGLGALAGFRGLPEGSINTLYVLDTARGKHVLRLSEGRREEEVRFETSLLRHLGDARYPAVRLVPRVDGRSYGTVKERFACVFHWAAGESIAARETSPAQAMDSGRLLARLHVLGESFGGRLENRYGPGPVGRMIESILEHGSGGDAELAAALPLLAREKALFSSLPDTNEGIIHADWFPDNLRFLGERLASVLDFEMACRGPFVRDLATAIHAGCYDDDFVAPRVRALVAGYLEERPLSHEERAAFFAWARFSALRFTTTRILDFHLAPLGGDRLFKKDWRRFRDRLTKTIELGDRGWRELCGV